MLTVGLLLVISWLVCYLNLWGRAALSSCETFDAPSTLLLCLIYWRHGCLLLLVIGLRICFSILRARLLCHILWIRGAHWGGVTALFIGYTRVPPVSTWVLSSDNSWLRSFGIIGSWLGLEFLLLWPFGFDLDIIFRHGWVFLVDGSFLFDDLLPHPSGASFMNPGCTWWLRHLSFGYVRASLIQHWIYLWTLAASFLFWCCMVELEGAALTWSELFWMQGCDCYTLTIVVAIANLVCCRLLSSSSLFLISTSDPAGGFSLYSFLFQSNRVHPCLIKKKKYWS